MFTNPWNCEHNIDMPIRCLRRALSAVRSWFAGIQPKPEAPGLQSEPVTSYYIQDGWIVFDPPLEIRAGDSVKVRLPAGWLNGIPASPQTQPEGSPDPAGGKP